MNGLKARLISLKNRVQGHLRRKCKNARRGSSAMRKLFAIRRLRLKISKLSIACTYITAKKIWFLKPITAAIDCDYRRTLLLIAGNRRSQYSSGGKQEVKLVSSATQTEEVDVPSEAVTHLPTNSSESVTPVALPSTDLPPLSGCPRPPVMLRSPSLYSWDSCSTTVSTQSKERLNSWDSCSSFASTLSEEKKLNSWDSCSSLASTQSEEKKLNSWDSCSSLASTQSEEKKLNSWDSCSSLASTLSEEKKLNSWDSCSSLASTLSEEKMLNSWDSCSSLALTLSEEKKLNSWDSCSSLASTLSKEEHGISLRTSDDEDDKEGVECKDEEECAAIPSAGGNSVCSNDKLFPNTSSGIVADYTTSEGDSNVDDDGSDFNSDSDFDGNSSTSGSISDGEIQIIACDDAMEQSADEELEIKRVYRPVTQSSSSFGSKPELTLLTLPPKMTLAHPILTDLLLVPPLRQRQSESGKIVLPTTPPQILTDLLPVPLLRQR